MTHTEPGLAQSIELYPEEIHTILAALKLYHEAGMGLPENRPDRLQTLACPTIDDTSLDQDGVFALFLRLIPYTKRYSS